MVGDFWGNYENRHFSNKKTDCGLFLGHFWRILGFFLFQHLVTLAHKHTDEKEANKHGLKWTTFFCREFR